MTAANAATVAVIDNSINWGEAIYWFAGTVTFCASLVGICMVIVIIREIRDES